MPEKECPDCSAKVHVRVRTCACGFVFPVKAKKSKRKNRQEEATRDAEYIFNGWKRVRARTRNAKCGICPKKLKGGDMAWHSFYDDGEKYFWCEKCMNSIGEYSNV
tara:strand:+ start:1439 stop:1756 length:318 start_codon:yes stop_codon:yes gene_type:complete